MKRFFTLLFVLLFILGGCGLSPKAPEKLRADDKVYKTDFYGTLFPNEFKKENETITADGIELTKIKHDTFELYHTRTGSYTEGTVYCIEDDYKKALAFYNSPDNYSYYCILGVTSDTTTKRTVEINEVNKDKFNSLLEFAEKSRYDPFSIKHNAGITKVELPMPDDTKDTRMIFYKESCDRLFVSSKGSDYYIIDGHLYLVFQYDFGHGEYEKLIAVKTPDDISEYFVEFMNSYI